MGLRTRTSGATRLTGRATATIALACGSAAILGGAPSGPVHAHNVHLIGALEAGQLREIGIAPLGAQSAAPATAATDAVERLAAAPPRPARLAAATVAATTPLVPLRLRGRVGDSLYSSLLDTGLAAATASEYLRILAAQPGIGGDVGGDDHFDLVLSGRRAGQRIEGALLYAAIDRVGASDVRVMKWPVGRGSQWVDAGATEQQATTLGRPVAGRVTSGFGVRVHPILHFARSHRGVDFEARWGQPIIAVADGVVSRAGWAGGYGRQVRISHGGGLATSYSHMSRTAVAAGGMVRAGQVIGYVGSSGLSTGPHLHYEVSRGGVAVNPLGVRFAGRARLEGGQANAFRARLGQFLALAPQVPAAS